ncbi:macro domain-containing protein [Weissella cibaria]|uniref:macro domain-containing protein n=1 Tax=Weissella cibaria TaxID=137591 RepID=UPI003B511DC3
MGFLLTFWSEVDRIYNNRSVVIPVFGSGILRFTDGYEGASAQDLLEIIIWTFKISRIKIEYPSRIKIVVFENKSDKYNLIKLKEIEKDGL